MRISSVPKGRKCCGFGDLYEGANETEQGLQISGTGATYVPNGDMVWLINHRCPTKN